MRRDEDRFGVSGGESSSRGAGAGLHDDRRPLGRRLADVWAWDGEVFSLVVDLSHKIGVAVDGGFAVESDGVGAPGRVPEFVDDVHVFFADGVALVVLGLFLAIGQVAGCAVEVAGYDVPADSRGVVSLFCFVGVCLVCG